MVQQGDRFLVCPSPATREDLIDEIHHQYCHVGTSRMLAILKESYWWPTMRQDTIKFCTTCLAC